MGKRKEFTLATKRDARKRARGKCENCGATLTHGKVGFARREEHDHDNPDYFSKDNSLENCVVLCRTCHVEKTRKDIADIAKSKRREERDMGFREPPKQTIQSRGFQKRKKRGRIELPNELPPPPLARASMENAE